MDTLQKNLRAILIASLALLAGCGYQLQGSKNPLDKLGIHKIYVENFTNRTIRPGLEQYFTTAMVREIRKGRVFELVATRDEADAVMGGSVGYVEDMPSPSAVQVGGTTPANIAATIFTAQVSCNIFLKDTTERVVFMNTFNGSKNHQASLVLKGNQVEQYANATAPLINESQQRLAIRYLADQMMLDAYQELVGLF